VITFQVTVNEGATGVLTNSAEHDANLLGAEPEFATWVINLERYLYLPVIGR